MTFLNLPFHHSCRKLITPTKYQLAWEEHACATILVFDFNSPILKSHCKREKHEYAYFGKKTLFQNFKECWLVKYQFGASYEWGMENVKNSPSVGWCKCTSHPKIQNGSQMNQFHFGSLVLLLKVECQSSCIKPERPFFILSVQ